MDKREKEALRKFGLQLTHLRIEKRLTIAELAGLSGLDPGLIGKIEAGEVDFELSVIFVLAEGLGVDYRRLVETL